MAGKQRGGKVAGRGNQGATEGPGMTHNDWPAERCKNRPRALPSCAATPTLTPSLPWKGLQLSTLVLRISSPHYDLPGVLLRGRATP